MGGIWWTSAFYSPHACANQDTLGVHYFIRLFQRRSQFQFLTHKAHREHRGQRSMSPTAEQISQWPYCIQGWWRRIWCENKRWGGRDDMTCIDPWGKSVHYGYFFIYVQLTGSPNMSCDVWHVPFSLRGALTPEHNVNVQHMDNRL